MNVIKETLSNGIRAVIVELPGRDLISTSVFVGAGSRYESHEIFGISHFIEHMVSKGTEEYPNYEDIALALESYGGEQNAGTSKDNTYYWNIVNKKYYKSAFDVLAQQVAKPLFDPVELEKEKGVVIEEIHRDNDEPADFASRKMGELLWQNHPLSCDILGPIENIRNFKREDLIDYVNKYYVAENMVIAVAGGIKAEEILPELENYFSIVPNGKKHLSEPADMSQAESRVAVYEQNIEQDHVFYVFKTIAHNDSRRYALDVLLSILGKGMGSVLFREIRENRGLAYTIEAFNRYMTDGGFCGVYAGLNAEKTADAIRLIKEKIFESKEILFSEVEIKRAKEYLKGLFLIGNLESTADITYYFGRKELLYPDSPTYGEREKLIDAVTAEEIRQVAKEMFLSERENLVVVGPYHDHQIFANILNEVK